MGIGAAGGKSAANEGAVLAARLVGLKKERSQRAASLKEEDARKPELVSSVGSDTIGVSPVEMAQVIEASNSKKSSAKKKKKNKKKR